jgi:hypothetical protein
MAEESLPDWLAEMRGQSFDDEPAPEMEVEPPRPPFRDESPPVAEEPEPEKDQFSQLFADLPSLEPQPDMVDDLREQMIQPGGFYDYGDEESGESGLRLPSPIPGLKSWQSLVVAVLFALDVALCGLMILFMTGRMALPY